MLGVIELFIFTLFAFSISLIKLYVLFVKFFKFLDKFFNLLIIKVIRATIIESLIYVIFNFSNPINALSNASLNISPSSLCCPEIIKSTVFSILLVSCSR